MKTFQVVWFAVYFLMVSVCSFAQNWNDAASVKEELIRTAGMGETYYSQFNYYDPRKKDFFNSPYRKLLQCEPHIYGVDFLFASGTWFDQRDVKKARKNLVEIVKKSWRERRAIASFSWHLENPYVPTGFSPIMGCRYVYSKGIPDYPVQHRYVIKEILENSGEACGKGSRSGQDNEFSYPSPGAWFEDRCKEVAGIINEFVDDEGRPIPFIFRLWHEWEDSWMWWGAKYVSAEDYKRFFILTEQTIMKYAPEAQILWSYCSDRYVNSETEYMERYPGNDYVDIIGFDDYFVGRSETDWAAAVSRAKMVCKIADERHLATALFETNNSKQKVPGYYTDFLNRMLTSPEVNLGIVQIWGLKNDNDSTDLRSFVNRKNIKLRGLVE